jgi:UDP-N-acetylmuramate--alanine ligase
MTSFQGPIHLVGIGGMHMSAIAQLLLQQGVAVTGSDLRSSALTERVEAMGGSVVLGHAAENVGDATLVVTTAAAAADNPEIVAAHRRGIPVILRAEMVARLMEGKRVIAVAGSHGKTTTSSLIAFILSEASLRPMYLLGGESRDLGGNASWGEGEWCVVEADEYKRAFLEYSPAISVILNAEPDHLDYYGTPEAYQQAFVEFAGRTVPGGLLLTCADDRGAALAASGANLGPGVKRETYGLDSGSTWVASAAVIANGDARFNVVRSGEPLGEITIHRPAMHLVLNSLAATAVSLHAGVSFETIQDAVGRFQGARRRMELTGEARGIAVYDDYAHHPSEVVATIKEASARFPGRRLVAVHQPHTYSRISYLWDDWTRCWAGLDALFILETYAAREEPLPGRGARDLAAAIVSPEATYVADFDEAARAVVSSARDGDVVFTIGAGDVVEVGPKILELLQ